MFDNHQPNQAFPECLENSTMWSKCCFKAPSSLVEKKSQIFSLIFYQGKLFECENLLDINLIRIHMTFFFIFLQIFSLFVSYCSVHPQNSQKHDLHCVQSRFRYQYESLNVVRIINKLSLCVSPIPSNRFVFLKRHFGWLYMRKWWLMKLYFLYRWVWRQNVLSNTARTLTLSLCFNPTDAVSRRPVLTRGTRRSSLKFSRKWTQEPWTRWAVPGTTPTTPGQCLKTALTIDNYPGSISVPSLYSLGQLFTGQLAAV